MGSVSTPSRRLVAAWLRRRRMTPELRKLENPRGSRAPRAMTMSASRSVASSSTASRIPGRKSVNQQSSSTHITHS